MHMKKLRSKQIKTLETLIIQKLKNPHSKDCRILPVFAYIYHHFSDEEYLHGIEHSRILTTIYINDFYKYKTTAALSQEMHIDNKTLLTCRKLYLKMFAKYYLNLKTPMKTDFALLYSELVKSRAKENEKTA